jgi:diketogulonate reductase-like aldo/keto reductase
MGHVRLSREVQINGFGVPTFFYGTAWKEDDTERLTLQALALGFRAIDTANQRRHYVEAAVGAAVATAIQRGTVSRSALFLQTKFTHVGGQDSRLPYDAGAEPRAQVMQSFSSSLEHLRTTYIDSYVLHGPTTRHRLSPEDREVWQAMTELRRSGSVRLLGVSNVGLDQLEALVELDGAPPAFVQNRCYASTGWDREIRRFCSRHGVRYQGFSLLTANREVLKDPGIARIARRVGATPAGVVFRFALDVGMLPLTGTSSLAHGREALAIYDLPPLTDAEIESIERLGRPR